MRVFCFVFLLLLGLLKGKAQQQNNNKQLNPTKYTIEWRDPINSSISENEKISLLNFSTAGYSFEDNFLPRLNQEISISGTEDSVSARLINPVFTPLTDKETLLLPKNSVLYPDIQINTYIYSQKKKKRGMVSFIPLRKNNTTGKIEKLLSYDLLVSPVAAIYNKNLKTLNQFSTTASVLKTGKWYKIAIATDGIYKLDYLFLKQLGIDVDAINPQNIRIYGNGGGMLPGRNSVYRPDDLLQNAIVVEGENDKVFNKEDYILFYGRGPHRWKYAANTSPAFQHITNLYSDSAYYFINTDIGAGKRITTQTNSLLPPTHIVNSFDDYAFHENDDKNLINSGSQWFGEYFDNISSYNFNFNFPSIEPTTATVKVNLASRYENSSSSYFISCQNGSTTFTVPSASSLSYDYAHTGNGTFTFNPTNDIVTVTVTKQTKGALAWLDYIEVNARRKLTMAGNQLIFRDISSVGTGNIAQYQLTISSPVKIWDITNPANVYLQDVTVTSNMNQFTLPADSLKEFIAFNGLSYLTPIAIGQIENQNLHGLKNSDYIIVAYPDFLNEAQQLATIHEKEDNLSSVIVTPQQIYNEFSSGAQDITAIRDFVRMMYKRAATPAELPKYLLLFGDGSYNNKRGTVANTNFIPTYQSFQSTNYTTSYVSDDYYGLLDDTEGEFSTSSKEAVDIGIGRFPVKSKLEAQTAINKIVNYIKTGVPPTTTNKACLSDQSSPFGDWRNTICFVADDDDYDMHVMDAEKLVDTIKTNNKSYNIDKIYLDAYQQISTPGGERYPDVNDAINKRIERGCLIFNYTGHGGEVGLAHERIVDIPMINRWNNINNLPLFFTATCEFSRYDDPNRTSAGEFTFLNPKGGAIALFTTVRLVYATFNSYLNNSFIRDVFTPVNGTMPRLGDIFQSIKAEPINLNINSRNFSLLGDPALRLTYPKLNVITDSINNVLVTSSSSDTLKALSLITVSGHIDNNGTPLTDYNGVLYPTVYNKIKKITTLSNKPPNSTPTGGSPPYTFELQKDPLYKGKASIVNGYFKFQFIVPKDIDYKYGIGRISYYAEDGNTDASGYYDKVIVGGIDSLAATDIKGPEINLFMNDEKFVSGSITNESPDIYAVLKDDNGVNTVGNGIGHDIVAVLDGNKERSIILNDYYQGDLNSYKSGTVRYPLKDLSEGKHTLNLKVWDVYNNSSISTIEFVVSKSSELAIDHVLNYPNPFTTHTQFLFEHNQCCQLLNVQLQVFTVSGKLVKNISKYIQAEGYRVNPIEWDGRDDYGDRLAKGVYIYRLRVKNSRGASTEKFEKLVILN